MDTSLYNNVLDQAKSCWKNRETKLSDSLRLLHYVWGVLTIEMTDPPNNLDDSIIFVIN